MVGNNRRIHSTIIFISHPKIKTMKDFIERIKSLLHENTYAEGDFGKVIPIDFQHALIKAVMEELNKLLTAGFRSPEDELFFFRASLPLHISLSAFVSHKRGYPHPHWVLAHETGFPVERFLRWTGTKAEAVELIYELVHVGVLNNGQATIMQVTRWFEKEFNMELGNVSKTFQDIRNRKKETTSFAAKMDKALRQYIEQLDDLDLGKNGDLKRA